MTTIDYTPVLQDAADYITAHGWVQDTEEDDEGRVCLTGAVRQCTPQPGDFYIVRAALRARGHGEIWNDAPQRRAVTVIRYLRTAEVKDADLTAAFGPQWEAIVALVRRGATLTRDESDNLRVAGGWVINPDSGAVFQAASVSGRTSEAAAFDAAFDAAWGSASNVAQADAAADAARALAVRDLIGQHGFTADHYRTLTNPWRQAIGPAHPNDIKDGLA